METKAGIKLTAKQKKNVDDFTKLMNRWDKNLCINSIAGNLHIMMLGDTDQNPIPELSTTGGFNGDNSIVMFTDVYSDGGDW